jgi:hypothetical protein
LHQSGLEEGLHKLWQLSARLWLLDGLLKLLVLSAHSLPGGICQCLLRSLFLLNALNDLQAAHTQHFTNLAVASARPMQLPGISFFQLSAA